MRFLIAPGPGRIAFQVSQDLADQLRLNQILTFVDLSNLSICDEKVKAPVGQTSGFWGGRGRSWETETEFSWGVRCQLCQLRELPVDHAGSSAQLQCAHSSPQLGFSSWPLPRANSAGPRRRLSCQQDRDKSRPGEEQDQRRRP